MEEIDLSPSQREALDAFGEFLKGPRQVFLLRGAAGTGKTTTVRQMLDMARRACRCDDAVVLMAPTGRAAHILQARTGHPAHTIHRTIYSLQKVEYVSAHASDPRGQTTGVRLKFALNLDSRRVPMVCFVDEASMVSNTFADNEAFGFGSGCLLDDLMTWASQAKVVFIGDAAQLPPVGMNFSPALDSRYLSQRYRVSCHEATLTQVMRQLSDSGVLANAEAIRRGIEAREFTRMRLADGQGVAASHDLAGDFVRFSRAHLSRSVVVTWRNADAMAYNTEIRRRLYGPQAPRLVPGELLVVSRNNYCRGELFNGTVVKVVAFDPDEAVVTRTVNLLRKEKVDGKTVRTPVALRFRNVTVAFLRDGKAQTIPYVMLDSFLDSEQAQVGRDIAAALFIDFKIRHPRLKPGSPEFTAALLADEYYNALVCKYGYAMTCHKAQGGEWEKVFVDMARNGDTACEDYFRWAYTAITRSSDKLWHCNSPQLDPFAGISKQPISLTPNLALAGCGDYRQEKFEAVKRTARAEGVECEQDLTAAWQHKFIFTDKAGRRARLVLWFRARGYSNKEPNADQCTDHEFALQCRRYLEAEADSQFEFTDTGRPELLALYRHVAPLLSELGIRLLNIVNCDWNSSYHLRTSGHAVVEFWYNAKGQFTQLRPTSDLGEGDDLLQRFINEF